MALMDQYLSPTGLAFMKMHGLGNDFVVVDQRGGDRIVTPELAAALGDRNRGVGFDQLAVIGSAEQGVTLEFFNSDGSLSAACGNATRCVGEYILSETGATTLEIKTSRGVLMAQRLQNGAVNINMGPPQLTWQEVPLARDVDLNALPLDGAPSACGMGNPHCVFFVDDVDAVDVASLGPRFEVDPLFPERANIEFVQVLDSSILRMRVWERGTGITLACGSGACAALVAAHRRGLADARATLKLDGGDLEIDWQPEGVWMSGPTAHVFDGQLTDAFLRSL